MSALTLPGDDSRNGTYASRAKPKSSIRWRRRNPTVGAASSILGGLGKAYGGGVKPSTGGYGTIDATGGGGPW